MPDPIPGCDPSEAYDVVPMPEVLRGPEGWSTVRCNGIRVRHFASKTNAERYAMDAKYRASLMVTKYAGQ
jgi:hypothetical protein